MEHALKTWKSFYDEVLVGNKPFEVRKNDRGFQKGDVLWLREWDQDKAAWEALSNPERYYTGRHHKRPITYVLTGGRFGIMDGYVVLGLGHASEIT
jgi:hypothetical protein